MRGLFAVLLISGVAWGQATDAAKSSQTPSQPSATAPADKAAPGRAPTEPPSNVKVGQQPNPTAMVIPAGSKIPLALKQAISTKNAREGDPVYAETTFPFVLNERVLVPPGTYIQGKIMHVERAGRVKGRAEILIHFTSLIYPSGYTVMLPASVENTPGADSHNVKDKEGTIQEDKNTGKKIEDAAKNGVYGTMGGATAGGLATGSLNGARVGAGIGAATGIAWALLKRGPDVRLDAGTSIEMEIQRDIPVDGSRIQVARAGS